MTSIDDARMLLGAIGLLALAIPGAREAMAAEELRILAWEGYADEDWVKEFEKETGAKVTVVYRRHRRRDLVEDQGQRGRGLRPVRGQHRASCSATSTPGWPSPHDLGQDPQPGEDAAALPRSGEGARRRPATARSTAFRSPSIRSA